MARLATTKLNSSWKLPAASNDQGMRQTKLGTRSRLGTSSCDVNRHTDDAAARASEGQQTQDRCMLVSLSIPRTRWASGSPSDICPSSSPSPAVAPCCAHLQDLQAKKPPPRSLCPPRHPTTLFRLKNLSLSPNGCCSSGGDVLAPGVIQFSAAAHPAIPVSFYESPPSAISDALVRCSAYLPGVP